MSLTFSALASRLPLRRILARLGSYTLRPSEVLSSSDASLQARRYSSPADPASEDRLKLTKGQSFLRSDEALLRALKRKQQNYRLKEIQSKRKTLRREASQLAEAELRWIVEHVRQPASDGTQAQSSKEGAKTARSTLTREQRRKLIWMVSQMTREEVPVSYLLGNMPFGSLPKPLQVRPPILLPRPETEDWASKAANAIVEHLTKSPRRPSDPPLRIIDLCTGSGCIALLVAHTLRERVQDQNWHVTACDRSPTAVALARENASNLGFSTDRLLIHQADVFNDEDINLLAEKAGGPFDVILGNPPYIPRTEWEALPVEVKKHEDPAALIGERQVTHSDSPNSELRKEASEDASKDKDGLAFHRRFADLLFRSSFSSLSSTIPSSSRPRLVAEYGKGQHKSVKRIYTYQIPPKSRLPRIIKLPQRLVIVGLGNAMTHPLTRHSIGQVVLDGLLDRINQDERALRNRLREVRYKLETMRKDLIEKGTRDLATRQDWHQEVPGILPCALMSDEGHSLRPIETGFDLKTDFKTVSSLAVSEGEELPTKLTKVRQGRSGGWSAIVPILVPPTADSRDVVYQVDVALYKPSHPMNLSGVGLKAFLEAHTASSDPDKATDNVLVLQDDLDLDFGTVRMKKVGSARGHNGIRDIISRLQIPDMTVASKKGKVKTPVDEAQGHRLSRVRIGIGRPDAKPKASEASSGAKKWLRSPFGNKGGKPMPIDKWVLSKLKQEELDSCQQHEQGNVLDKVNSFTKQWIAERVDVLKPSPEAIKNLDTQMGKLDIRIEPDQFGVERTIWIQ